MDHDIWVVILTNLGTFIGASVFWIAYGVFKADKMRQDHSYEVEHLKGENRAKQAMIVQQDKAYMVMKEVPVSRLIGNGIGDK